MNKQTYRGLSEVLVKAKFFVSHIMFQQGLIEVLFEFRRSKVGLGVGTEYLFKVSTEITQYQVLSEPLYSNDSCIQSFLYPDLGKK